MLQKGRHAIPPYIRHAEADALLALRRPEDAATAYDDVLAADPSLRSARVGLFFARLEAGGRQRRAGAGGRDGGGGRPEARHVGATGSGSTRSRWRPSPGTTSASPVRRGVGCSRWWKAPRRSGSSARRRRRLRRLADGRGSRTRSRTSQPRSRRRIVQRRSRSRKRRSLVSATTRHESRTSALVTLFPGIRQWSGCGASVRAHDAVELRIDSRVPHRARQRRRQPRLWLRRPIEPVLAAVRRTLATQGGRTSTRRPPPSRASSGARVTARASRPTGPMRRSRPRRG